MPFGHQISRQSLATGRAIGRGDFQFPAFAAATNSACQQGPQVSSATRKYFKKTNWVADARDSKSRGPKGSCGFDSLLRH